MLQVAVALFCSVPFAPSPPRTIISPAGKLEVATGVLSEPLQGDLERAARNYAWSRATEIGLPVSSTLGKAVVIPSRLGASFRFPQQVGGVEVWGSTVVVTLDKSRRVTELTSSVTSYDKAVLDWRMTKDQALRRAASSVLWPALKANGEPYGGVRRQLFLVGSQLVAGYYVYVPTLRVTENWHLAINAQDGSVLWKNNRVFRSHEADVYVRSPGGLDAGVGVTPVTRVNLLGRDGGSWVLDNYSVVQADGGISTFANDAGNLIGSQIVSFGCCPNLGCSTEPDAGSRRAVGTTNFQGFVVNYDLAVCDRLQRATNDSAQNPTGSFVYTPFDDPQGPVAQSNLSDSDPFSEVQVFYHVNRIYDWFRELSESASSIYPDQNLPNFALRDERRTPPRPLMTLSNVTIPDIGSVNPFEVLATGTARVDTLTRVDNAAFLPREQFEQLSIPEIAGTESDALMLFQGGKADFGYDAPVVWHEFGHAVITSTANFSSYRLDSLSANNEGGALHEAIADYFAVAYDNNSSIGDYVGPRMQIGNGGQLDQISGLRDANNSFACPDVLWGEVHQDAMHITGALWQARKDYFQGNDAGRTFDAVIFASLAAMAPNTHFESAAALISNKIQQAFPSVSEAKAKIEKVFADRGITGCSKVLDMTDAKSPRPYYGIPGKQDVGINVGVVPGPLQMKIRVPNGTRSVSFSASFSQGPTGQTPNVTLLASRESPIVFVRTGTELKNDSEVQVVAKVQGSTLTAKANLDTACGENSAVFLAIGTSADTSQVLSNLSVSYEKAVNCASPDAGTPAPTQPLEPEKVVAPTLSEGTGISGKAIPLGCGCSSSGSAAEGLMALGLLALRRRRKSVF